MQKITKMLLFSARKWRTGGGGAEGESYRGKIRGRGGGESR